MWHLAGVWWLQHIKLWDFWFRYAASSIQPKTKIIRVLHKPKTIEQSGMFKALWRSRFISNRIWVCVWGKSACLPTDLPPFVLKISQEVVGKICYRFPVKSFVSALYQRISRDTLHAHCLLQTNSDILFKNLHGLYKYKPIKSHTSLSPGLARVQFCRVHGEATYHVRSPESCKAYGLFWEFLNTNSCSRSPHSCSWWHSVARYVLARFYGDLESDPANVLQVLGYSFLVHTIFLIGPWLET